MRRDINWKAEDADGNRYRVRVHFFGGVFSLQFQDEGSEDWDYRRRPSTEDMEEFLSTIRRRYRRRQATYKQLQLAERMLKDHLREISESRE